MVLERTEDLTRLFVFLLSSAARIELSEALEDIVEEL